MIQTNATLTRVQGAGEGGGTGGDWGHGSGVGGAAVPGPDKWAGAEPAYYLEKLVERADGVDFERRLIIVSSSAAAAAVDQDDLITFTDPAGVQRTTSASEIARARLAGMGQLATTTLTLEPEDR